MLVAPAATAAAWIADGSAAWIDERRSGSAPGHGGSLAAIQPGAPFVWNQSTIRGSRFGQLAVTGDPVEAPAGEARRGDHRELAVVDKANVEPGFRGGLPQGHVEGPGDGLDPVEQVVQLGLRIRQRRQQPDRVPRTDLAFDEDPGVHPRVERMGQDRDPTGSPVAERPGDRVARHVRLADLEHDPVTDRGPGPDRKGRPLDPLGRQVLARRSRPDRVAVGLHPPDRLDREQGNRAVWSAVDGVAAVAVPGEPERTDPGPLDRQLRDAPAETFTWSTRPSIRAILPDGRRRAAVTSGRRRSGSPGSGR